MKTVTIAALQRSWSENMEENVLRFMLIGEKLDVIYNEDINELIKMHKVIYRVVFQCIDELVGKFFG